MLSMELLFFDIFFMERKREFNRVLLFFFFMIIILMFIKDDFVEMDIFLDNFVSFYSLCFFVFMLLGSWLNSVWSLKLEVLDKEKVGEKFFFLLKDNLRLEEIMFIIGFFDFCYN